MTSQFEGFSLDDEKLIASNDGHQAINFNKLMETLKQQKA
jgi:hypothetical protein